MFRAPAWALWPFFVRFARAALAVIAPARTTVVALSSSQGAAFEWEK